MANKKVKWTSFFFVCMLLRKYFSIFSSTFFNQKGLIFVLSSDVDIDWTRNLYLFCILRFFYGKEYSVVIICTRRQTAKGPAVKKEKKKSRKKSRIQFYQNFFINFEPFYHPLRGADFGLVGARESRDFRLSTVRMTIMEGDADR